MNGTINLRRNAGLMILLLFLPLTLFAQKKDEAKPVEDYQFTVIKQAATTPVISQGSSGTCWCFGTTSFVESEIIRLHHDTVNLSEMFTVRHVLADKAENYVRFHGTVNFDQGGEQHDVLNCFRTYGAIPQDLYPGLNYGEDMHKHGEVMSELQGVVQSVIKNKNGKLSPVWLKGFNGILDAYFGKIPENFTYKGQTFTPESFAQSLDFNPDDYVEFTSFTHHPFYQPFVLEIPDNWAQQSLYNVPLDELMEIMDYSLNKGISISWGADISGLNFAKGVATVPAEGEDPKDPQHKEKTITQQDRQKMFDTYQLTDDHCMHLVGIAHDQFGKKFYIEKNSWGAKGKYKGFSYMSEPFMRIRTMSIMVHKDGIPESIAAKIGLK
ncbi:MAG: aminopeptidase [Bacteroidales bacterium]|nr:aminopeptidase [Bacteroidales bacterium]